MLTVMTKLCQQIWKTKEWPEMWSKSLIITIPKKGDLKVCANYRTISLLGESNRIRTVPNTDTLGISEIINPTKNCNL